MWAVTVTKFEMDISLFGDEGKINEPQVMKS